MDSYMMKYSKVHHIKNKYKILFIETQLHNRPLIFGYSLLRGMQIDSVGRGTNGNELMLD